MLLTSRLRARATDLLSSLVAAVLDWRPFALAALTAALVVICAQVPVSYAFRVGYERGPISDQPFLQSFYPTEGEWPDGLFRWSRGEFASITLPGVGRRAMVLVLTIASHRAQHNPETGPTLLTLRHQGSIPPPQFTLRPEAARYLVLLPPEALPDGAARIQLETPSWQNQGDSRDKIGVALAQSVRLETLRPDGLVLPDLGMLLGFPAGVLLLWGTVRVCGFGTRSAALLIVPVAIFGVLLSLADPLRAGFAGPWAVPFGLIAIGGAAGSALVLPQVLHWMRAPAPAAALRWLGLLMALTIALKYGGRFYPDSMPGDWQLHINRFTITNFGDLTIQARHRGLPFPFPPGYYIDIAPLLLTGFEIRPLLPLLAGLFEMASIPVLYAIPARALGSARIGVLSAAIYALTAHGFMNTWFSFHTQISTQFFTALLALILTISWPHYDKPSVWWPVAFLLMQQFVGHIGTLINAGLLGILTFAGLLLRAQSQQERRAALALLWAGIAVGALAMLFYYTTFWGLIVEQVTGVTTRGLVDVSGKQPLLASTHLQVLWEGGLITHFGFFPVLLAIPGALALSRRLRRSALPVLLWGTFAVSFAQALLPFLTQSAIMTRWLTFAAWAVAVAGAVGLALWWRRGRAARLAALAMAAYVCWITAMIMVEAMTQRLPPIEPF